MGYVQPSKEVVDSLLEAAEAANERIRMCHEVVSCPKCGAPVGKKCRSMPRGYRPLDLGDRAARELKSPHRQRWTRVQPARLGSTIGRVIRVARRSRWTRRNRRTRRPKTRSCARRK